MDFFDDLVKKVSDKAQSAVKKSGEVIEITKLKTRIVANQKTIEDNYLEIGKILYQRYLEGENVESQIKNLCEEIKSKEEIIKSIKEEIISLKGSVECQKCHAVVERTSYFCPNCGEKLPEPKETEVESEGFEENQAEDNKEETAEAKEDDAKVKEETTDKNE